MISYEDFAKIDIRAGKILSAEKIPDTDKLLKLSVDLGEVDLVGKQTLRQIVSGIAMHFPDPTALVGRTCMFIANIEPRTIRGQVSNGMVLAISTPEPENLFSLLEPGQGIPPGTKAK
jgi:methionyl-tRNA synthetase